MGCLQHLVWMNNVFQVFFLWTILFNTCVHWCIAVFGREMVCNNNRALSGKCTAWVNWQWVSFACSCTTQWNLGFLLAAQLFSVFAQDWTSSEAKKRWTRPAETWAFLTCFQKAFRAPMWSFCVWKFSNGAVDWLNTGKPNTSHDR